MYDKVKKALPPGLTGRSLTAYLVGLFTITTS